MATQGHLGVTSGGSGHAVVDMWPPGCQGHVAADISAQLTVNFTRSAAFNQLCCEQDRGSGNGFSFLVPHIKKGVEWRQRRGPRDWEQGAW